MNLFLFQLKKRLQERKVKQKDEAAALFSLGERQKTILEKMKEVINLVILKVLKKQQKINIKACSKRSLQRKS